MSAFCGWSHLSLFHFKQLLQGNSLVVWRLGLATFTAGAWVQSLVRELRNKDPTSHKAWPTNNNKKRKPQKTASELSSNLEQVQRKEVLSPRQTSTLLAHLPWKHQHPPTQLRATVNAKPAGTVKAGNSPQLLSPSLSCTLMKFSIQKGSQTQRLVNESQWPWSEQFNWHAASRRRGSRSTGVRAGGGPPSGAHEDGMGPPDPCLW